VLGIRQLSPASINSTGHIPQVREQVNKQTKIQSPIPKLALAACVNAILDRRETFGVVIHQESRGISTLDLWNVTCILDPDKCPWCMSAPWCCGRELV